PMFPGYAFVNHAMDKWSYTALLKTRGLVRILGERWDRLEAVPAAEIEAIRRVAAVDAPVMPHPYLRQGQRVRIVDGPLIGGAGSGRRAVGDDDRTLRQQSVLLGDESGNRLSHPHHTGARH